MKTLLLINIAGSRYGLWEDALTAVRGALPLHRLPLSPPAIAGIAILDDRSAVIADLAAALGSPPLKDHQNASFLIIDPREKIAGFVVAGAVDRIEHPAEQVLPVPAALSTPVIDACAVIDHAAVPIINIRALQERLKQGILEMPRPAGGIEASPHSGPQSFAVRAFLTGGERFCVNAAGTAFAPVSRERIATIPAGNDWLAGIAVHDHAVLPLVRLDGLLGIEARSDRGGMLIASADGGRHGLLVDEDLGIIDQKDLRMNELPALARQSWMPAAAVSSGKVYPLIEAGRVIPGRAEEEKRETAPSFTPDSEFPRKFRTGEVEVVEFSLLGASHAVPKDEVKEILPLLPISRIPHTAEIVMGVADLNGELLPVLDLAAVFGRRSAVNGKWRLMRIANGDFHALVVTEEVRGDRRLGLESQKLLPIALPHQVLYGCYLDGGFVRLIMNVQSLAVHFEKAAVRELVTSLAPETALAAVKSVPDAPKTPETILPDVPSWEWPAIPEAAPVSADAVPIQPKPVGTPEIPAAARSAADGSLTDEDERRQLEAAKASKEALRQEEAEKRRREEETRQQEEEQAQIKKAEEEARQKALDEQRMLEERARLQAGEDARARAEEAAREQEREAARRKAAEEAQKRASEAAERRAAEPVPVPVPVAEEPVREERTWQEKPPVKRMTGKRRTIAALLAAALALVLFFISSPRKEPVPPVVKHEMPPAAQKSTPPPAGPKEEAPKAAPKKVKVPEPETLPPLYLTVPPERVILPEQEIYIVVKGDTLWGIAKRFTGDPLNYPRVARDNSIATPDLIFPGQRIRLVREKR
ncbi:MAG: chemotaxis protein CheW [Nitrospirota bacterium]